MLSASLHRYDDVCCWGSGGEIKEVAGIMHKFSTAPTKSSALAALRSVGLLNVPYSTFAGASDPQAGAPALARSALSSLRVTRTYA